MYAHQVIEDLHCFDGIGKVRRDEIIHHIQRSQQFHIGSLKDVQTPLVKYFGKQGVFTGDLSKYFRLPFKKCWFDWSHSNDGSLRAGLLVLERKGIDKSEPYGAFLVQFERALEVNNGKWFPSPYFIYVCSNKDEIIKSQNGERANLNIFNLNTMEEEVHVGDMIKNTLAYGATYLQGALMFLNCKNISTKKINPPEKLNKKRAKKNKQELFKYHVLKISNSKNQSDRSNNLKILNQNRIHFCRGHFKEYTKENPLFGQHTGFYWWQPHARGNKKKGVVMKDYEIAAQ